MFGREPVLWLALIQAGLALGVGFGLNVTTTQMGLIMAFSAALFAVITRQVSVPIATVKEAGTTVDALKAKAESNRSSQ